MPEEPLREFLRERARDSSVFGIKIALCADIMGNAYLFTPEGQEARVLRDEPNPPGWARIVWDRVGHSMYKVY